MKTSSMPGNAVVSYELRFQSLFHTGRGYAFPCDAEGRVDMDTLSDKGRTNYLYARATVGREFSNPTVRPSQPRLEAPSECFV